MYIHTHKLTYAHTHTNRRSGAWRTIRRGQSLFQLVMMVVLLLAKKRFHLSPFLFFWFVPMLTQRKVVV